MVIITTVGTSLLTNLLNKNIKKCFGIDINSDDIKEKIRKGTAKKEDINDIDFDTFIKGELKNDNKICKELIYTNNNYPDINLNASAEIKSICKIANGKPATVYLLATDTDMSEFAAEKIQEALNKRNGLVIIFDNDKCRLLNLKTDIENKLNNINNILANNNLSKSQKRKKKEEKKEYENKISLITSLENNKFRINNLSIEKPEKFQKSGFENLINIIDNIYNLHSGEEVVLNISGGYKALIPFLTIYAQIRNLPLMYIYENSEEVITIDTSYLGFKDNEVEVLEPFLNQYFLGKKDYTKDEEKIIEVLKKKHLINERNEVIVLGKLLKKYAEKIVYNKGSLGDIVELKLWEYFMKNKYNGYEVYHSQDIKADDEKAEIDLLFEKDNHVIYCEIKSFGRVVKEKESINSDFEKRKRIALKNNKILQEYWLLIYKAKFHDIQMLNLSELNPEIKVKSLEIDTFKNLGYGYNIQKFTHKNISDIRINNH